MASVIKFNSDYDALEAFSSGFDFFMVWVSCALGDTSLMKPHQYVPENLCYDGRAILR